MKHEGSVWHSGVDFLQAIEVEFDFAFVEAVGGTYRDCQGVNFGLCDEPRRIFDGRMAAIRAALRRCLMLYCALNSGCAVG